MTTTIAFNELDNYESEAVAVTKQPSNRFCQYASEILKTAWRTVSFLLSYTLIYSVVAEILLLIDVYSHHDGKFFALSITFLVCPLCLVSFLTTFGCGNYYGARSQESTCARLLHSLPIINIPFAQSQLPTINLSQDLYDDQKIYLKMLDTFLTGTMTFPLYIINLSFLLETIGSYSAISIYSIIQLIFSVLNMSLNPVKYVVEVNASTMCVYASSAAVLVPLVLIEIVHFFPFCFAYYVDHSVTAHDLTNILFIFNVPKLLLVTHIYYITAVSIFDMAIFSCCKFCSSVLFLIVFIIPVFVTVPLIPYVLLIEFLDIRYADEAFNTKLSRPYYYYIILVSYLWVSYGGSCFYMLLAVGFSGMSVPVQVSIGAVLSLVALITFTLPLSFRWMKEAGVSLRF